MNKWIYQSENIATEPKNLKIRARNLFWNKHFSWKYKIPFSKRLVDILKSFPHITYSIFTPEQGPHQSGFHFQGYLEFSKTVRAEAFDKQLANLWDDSKKFFSWLEPRKSTQLESIDYVKKEGRFTSRKDEQLDNYYEYGTPKLHIYSYNVENKTIPFNKESREVDVVRKIKSHYFSSFSDIERDFEHMYNTKRSWLKDLWNEHYPINKLNVVQAKVIWLVGNGGSGKSTWTKKYLRNQGYSDSDVAIISPQNMTYSDKVYFDFSYENCKALVINEVDYKFPKYNNLISFIDRNTLLATKGSHIRNNFELIIINSIYHPEEIFFYLGKASSQVLRRIYNQIMDCHVYHIFPNRKQLSQIIKENKEFHSDIEFQDWYQPIIKELTMKEHNYPEKLSELGDDFYSYSNPKSSLLKRVKSLFSS